MPKNVARPRKSDRPDRCSSRPRRTRIKHTLARLLGLGLLTLAAAIDGPLDAQCANPIACENALPGEEPNVWDITGSGDATVQGFATAFSVAPGDTQRFKIETGASSYTIDIYRMGYYGDKGARKVATITPSATLPQTQPSCLTESSTGLLDCGNWAVSASWTVPVGAVSGIYFARPRLPNGDASHIFFVVRDDSRAPAVLFQTGDTTWQAYNNYGGNSLYVGGPGTNPGRAYKVSYNRPFNTRSNAPEDWVFNAEYPMVRWLEANGYDVSYMSGADTDRLPAKLTGANKPKVFLSVGHDEYWSNAQRVNVEAARAAGVHLAFFSGNAIFWKTRWETSIDGSGTSHRTLVSYKETHADAIIDPTTAWTGTWRDPRFSPPKDGGRPENALMGTSFRVNSGTTAIRVPAAQGKHRFWRHTSIADLQPGTQATLANATLGYEWDEAPTDAFTPSGLMRLSTTTSTGQILTDFGSTYANGQATHSLTLYRHPSGALVFGGGTIQWSWGLDENHDRGNNPPDVRMQQATVNLLKDMGVDAATLRPGLVAPTASSDSTPPSSTITSPLNGASFPAGSAVTINGTATDSGGGIVTGVEVSVDGGATWMPASGTTNWTLQWTASGSGSVTIRSRAFDDTGNLESPGASVQVTVGCPCTLWGSTVPANPAENDSAAVELGTRFRADTAGFVTGVRFYKSTQNTGTHVGRLWTDNGNQLGSVTFTNETASGWQVASFASPIPIQANTTYVVSYHAPNGRYAAANSYFLTPLDNPPLHGVQNGQNSANGVYRYGGGGVFPTDTFQASAYFVDPVFTIGAADTTPPTVTTFSPPNGATGVALTTSVTATFSEAMDANTISPSTFELRNPSNVVVASAVSYDSATRVATLQPNANLAASTTYSVTVRGGAAEPRVKDLAGNALAADVSWSFTTAAAPPPPPSCPCTIWAPDVVPATIDTADIEAVELGTRFRSDVAGFITGVRFYKAATNTGVHTARLWSNAGAQLGSVTFTGETSTGWQEANFSPAIAISANTTYVISYHAPNGHYSNASGMFATGVDRPPLHALRDGLDGPNGAFVYGASAFPTTGFNSTSYFVDVVFNTTIGPDTTPPVVAAFVPPANQSGVSTSATVTATFNEAMNAATVTTSSFFLRDPSGTPLPATVGYDAATRTATLTPTGGLNNSTTYTAVVKGGATDPRVKDASNNALAADFTWSFTTAAPPPPPPGQGPGGPVLVITAVSNPFTTYFAEILRTEGLNAFLTADIASVSAATLSDYDVVILGQMTLSSAQETMLTNWVTQGGNLIAMRPDKDLAGLFGLTDAGTTLSDAYLLVNTASAPGTGIVNQTMQFHGTADRYTLNGATEIAMLYSNASTATANPAVTIRNVGANGGQAVAFTYDLARSVVYTRQGNPAWSGQERDNQTPIRSDDLYFGGGSPDYVDLNKVHIPQADEQQRLLWNTILHVNADRKPLPRFWYFPRMLKAVVVMTGDDHGLGGTAGRFDQYLAVSPPGCSVSNWECIRSTSYVYPTTGLSGTQVKTYLSQGFEIALHVNTSCADYSPASLSNNYTGQLNDFAQAFPDAPAPITNRTHCIAWSDYDTQPQVALANGIRFDTNYYYWPGSWITDRPGMFTGSGMPMRFATMSGQIVDVYQAATQMTDESGQSFPMHPNTLLDRAKGAEGFYGAFTANMHTDSNSQSDPGQQGSQAIIASAQARSVPVISSKQMLEWLDGRNGSSFGSIAWNGNVLSFTVAVGTGANGLHALVPASAGGGPISAVSRNGSAVTFSQETIKGVAYAVFAAQPGTYQVTYGADTTPPVISNVASAPDNTTATITWTTDEPSDSRVAYGTNPNTLDQSAAPAGFTTAHSVPLTGLTPGTTYFFRVSSADGQLNLATSPAPPNAPASFTTTQPQPSLSLTDASVTEGNSGTTNAVFTVNLSASSASTVTVQYTTAPGTAAADVDYVTTSGTLNFAGVTQQTIAVPVVGDALNEINEQFVVNLSNPVNATIADGQGAGTILNDDPVPTLSIADASVSEGQSGTKVLAFNVNLSAASGQTVTVAYATANGTATAPSDYVAASGTVTLNAGATTVPVNITINGDTTVEASEQFVVNLTNPSNATIADAQATGTILNDDGVPALSINDVTVTEGNAGTVNAVVTVSLSAASTQEVTVGYATANGTASAADYTGGSGTITFPIGSTLQTVTVPVIGDTLDEPDETIQVNLSTPTNATIGDAQGIITITDDDAMPTVSVSDVSLTEGNSGTKVFAFNLTLSAASGRTVTVRYGTANGTAVSGSDYVAVGSTTTATFQPGTTTATANVTVNGDILPEVNETFNVNLNTPTNATIADGQGIGTIQNDDALPNLTIGNRTVTENDTGTVNASFTVTLSPASGSTVTVNYATADGTANATSGDYVAATGTVTFTPGATSRTIVIQVSGDLIDENAETYTVNLSVPVNANITDGEGLGTINDNDPVPTISIADLTLTEGNSGQTFAPFTLSLSRASGKTVTVSYTTANGSATAGSDYVATSGTATFQPGSPSVVVNVPVNGDTTTEANESFVMNLSGPVNATIADAQAAAVILNDDGGTPPPTGLVAAYGFEEPPGTTTVTDASGNGHTGTISGATRTTAGRNGSALSFDGVNDMVNVADSAALDITRMTVMAWVRPSTLAGYRTAVIKERSGGLAYALYAHSDMARPEGWINTGGNDILTEGTAALSLNTWVHLAATYDGSSFRLYVNGVLVRTRSGSGNIVSSTQMLRIGGNTVWGEFFAGLIDDVRVYNRALSQGEIQTDMNVAVP